MSMHSYGWKGSFVEFLSLNNMDLLESLCLHIYGMPFEKAKYIEDYKPQIKAWLDCYDVLYSTLSMNTYQQGFVIFEYSILRGSGRRPDVLLIVPGEVIVLEFKSYNSVSESEYTQTSLYVRDLQNYHSAVHQFNLRVSGSLVLTSKSDERLITNEGSQIYIASRVSLTKLLRGIVKRSNGQNLISDTDFLLGAFNPLPSIIESAKAILRDDPLPQIRAIKSSNFDHVISEVQNIIQFARSNSSHHLVLVSGVPGAGKTFVGLKLAHETDNAVYLSGNGPLVDVLQDSLQNDTFVQSLYGYKNDYMRHGRVPNEQVIIFDEAQRAWDAEKMGGNLSEPDVIIQIAKHNKPWSVIIGLIGEGQEIHLGEEGGLGLWNTAIAGQNVQVHSKHVLDIFTNATSYHQNKNLHLNCSLRTHAAIEYYDFVNKFLDGDIEGAATSMDHLKKQRYTLRITRDLEKAIAFVSGLYEADSKMYGIVCASGNDRSKQVPVVPFGNRYELPKPAVAYFNYADSPFHCKNLTHAATEFQTQGLELDMAIVHWDDDLFWSDRKWYCQFTKRGALNPIQMKLNAYRVLMTRGRDGMIIYVPNKKSLDSLYSLLLNDLTMKEL